MWRALDPVLTRWPIFAALASAAMLGIAHAFETFGHLAPCTLCLRQREVYWVALAVAALGVLVLGRPRLKRLVLLALAAVFLIGCATAVYHAGAEWKFWPGPTTCSSTGAGGLDAAAMARALGGAKLATPHCDEAAWVFAGLSMAGWNALISLGLAGLSLAAARRTR